MLADLKSRINVDAEFQRGTVWTRPQQALLIDSILRGFDIPKLYFRKLPDGRPHLFDVIDGKQRLMAIWSFLNDELPLRRAGDPFDGLGDVAGKTWSQLPAEAKDRLQFASLTVSKLEDASEEQVRELFLRLQEGEPLRASEKRNAIKGPVRDFVADNLACHDLWPKTKIRGHRHGWDEHGAIVLALARERGPTALKGADLQRLYETGDFDPNGPAACLAERLLAFLEEVEDGSEEPVFRTRWALVDACVVVMRFWEENRAAPPPKVGEFLCAFDVERRQVGEAVRNLQTEVLELSRREMKEESEIYLPEVARDMLEYYLAFSREGASEGNVVTRATVMYERLVSFLDADSGRV